MIDLFSDTSTRPTKEMRDFIAAAEVGDEQRGADPSVNRLQEMVAELLGKEAALFLPSGTMCNEISFLVHCRPGDEILMDQTAHPWNYEGGGPAALSGALIRPLPGERGIFTAEQVDAAIRPPSRYSPRSRVLSVENTTNLGGGSCWPIDTVRSVCETARAHGLACHLDGARLMNAVVATGTPARAYAAQFDSAWIDLSKGLGAPVGGVLAGTTDFIAEAWRHKQRMGGAMRQAGIIAAAGVYALEHHIDRLADDHANARLLARGLDGISGITIDLESVETNIVIFDVSGTGMGAAEFAARLEDEGVGLNALDADRVRAVTHLDVTGDDCRRALETMERVVMSVHDLGKP